MSEAVIVQLIISGGTLLGAIAAGIFGLVELRKRRSAEAGRDAKLEAVRENVQNSHSTFLRDDLDKIIHAVETVADRVAQIERDGRDRDEYVKEEIRGMRRDIGRLGSADLQQAADQAELRKQVTHLGDRYHELEK